MDKTLTKDIRVCVTKTTQGCYFFTKMCKWCTSCWRCQARSNWNTIIIYVLKKKKNNTVYYKRIFKKKNFPESVNKKLNFFYIFLKLTYVIQSNDLCVQRTDQISCPRNMSVVQAPSQTVCIHDPVTVSLPPTPPVKTHSSDCSFSIYPTVQRELIQKQPNKQVHKQRTRIKKDYHFWSNKITFSNNKCAQNIMNIHQFSWRPSVETACRLMHRYH